MYCSQCGKKVMETMLFCPFCGSPIIIPDQDEEVIKPAAVAVPTESIKSVQLPADENAAVPTEERIIVFEEGVEEEAASEALEAAEEISTAGISVQEAEENVFLNLEVETSEIEEETEVKEEETSSNEPDFISLFDEQMDDAENNESEQDEDFQPLEIQEEETEIQWQKIMPKVEKKPPELRKKEEQSIRLDGYAPRLESKERKSATGKKAQQTRTGRSSETFVPVRPMNPEDMFMDDLEDDDDFDVYENTYEEDDHIYEFEDEDEGGFFMRHIRGLIGLSLLLVLALIFVFYGFSAGGQETLAQMNLAWKPEAYSKLAYQYYQEQRYNLAGSFYEKALSRDSDNYSYAESAAMVYITGENTDKAAIMLKKCIEISPSKAEPYVYLMNLYPDTAARPWDVSQLLIQGYRTTGDERLKSAAQ